MKKKRQDKILEIILNNDVSTQEDLLQYLIDEGFSVTQATVSRDIKELRIHKTLSSKGIYRYTAEEKREKNQNNADYTDMFKTLFSGSLVNVDFAGNICVLKCYPGLAQAACAAIDNMNVTEVVGTIAGDDTIFMLCRTIDEAQGVAEALRRMINN